MHTYAIIKETFKTKYFSKLIMAKDFCSAITYSGSSYAWAKCTCSKGIFSTSSSGTVGPTPIEPQVVEDDNSSASAAVADYQKELALYSKKVSSKLADKNTLSIPTSRLIFKVATFPSTDPAEIQQMALNEFEPQSPAPIEEMVFSFDLLEQVDGSSKILYAAAKEEDVLSQLLYLDVTPKKVERVDAYILGLVRNLIDENQLALEERNVIFACEGDALTMLVTDGRAPIAIRHIGNASAISSFALSSNISKTMRSVNSEFTKQPIAKLIFVDLQNSPITLQIEKIKQTINAPEELIPVMLTTSEKQIAADNTLPLIAVGVAKRSFDKNVMNLYPGTWKDELQQQKAKIRNISIFSAIICVWIALICYLYGYPYLITQKINKANAISEKLHPESSAVQDYRNRINIIDRYSDRSHSPLELLREVCIYMPEGIDLTQFRFRGPEKLLQIEGRATTTSIIYDFMNNLRSSKLFGENRLTSGPTHNKNLGKDVFELTIAIANTTDNPVEGGN